MTQDRGLLGDYFDTTLPEVLRQQAAQRPEHLAVRTVDGLRLTAAELWERIAGLAAGLQRLGLEPGSRVGVMLDNRVEILELFVAIPLAGHVFVPMNTAWRGKPFEHICGDSEPAVIVTDAGHEPEIRRALAARDVPAQFFLADEDLDALRAEPGALTALPSPAAKDLIMLLYTSGTTGPSKGNMYSHRAALHFAMSAAATLEYGPDDIVHSCLPLFHANALLCGFTGAMLRGSTFVLSPRFTASGFWEEVAAVDATHTGLMGSMVSLLMAREPRPADRAHSLRIAYCGPMPEHPQPFEERFGVRCASTYGLTDASIVTLRPVDDSGIGSAGWASPDWELRIVDDEGMPVAQGQSGELWARPRLPYIASLGYWRNPEATLGLWNQLWYNSGDILYQDEAGRYHFVDRKKDAIRKGGENVSSAEVEEVVLAFPGIVDAAVFAVPSELSEDEVMVAVVLAEGATLEPEELFHHCMRELAYFAVPRYIEVVTGLPRTENHRVRKVELRGRGRSEATWDAGPVTRRRVEAELSRRAGSDLPGSAARQPGSAG